MNNQHNIQETHQADAAKYMASMLADQCARLLDEKGELTEEEITEMYYNHLLRELAHETWPKM